jgi:GDPmannose 4,6-dehydratase
MNKSAIIIGSNGQDGRILYDQLLEKKYEILGIDKGSFRSTNPDWETNIDINNSSEVENIVAKIKPDEIYHLAAYHHSSQDAPEDEPTVLKKSYDIHVFSLANFLEAISKHSPKTKLFYAASSLIFGTKASGLVNEETPFNPDTPYGLSKLCGLNLCRMYREKHNVFASVGIFFNHESALRPEKFISRKIIQGAIDIKNKKEGSITVGNLNAEVDWGYAPDYTDAAHKILQTEKSNDFIIATGKTHSIKDLAKTAFDHLNLDWTEHVTEDSSVINRSREPIMGDATKLKGVAGWQPSVTFEEMITKIITELDT